MNDARNPSPAVSTSWPPKRRSSARTRASCLLEQIGPRAVAKVTGKLGRSDDVGEHHGRHGLRRLKPTPMTGQELLDFIGESRHVARPEREVLTGQLNPARSRDPFGEVLTVGDAHSPGHPPDASRASEPSLEGGDRERPRPWSSHPAGERRGGLLRGASALPTNVRTRRRPPGMEQRCGASPPLCPSHPSPFVGSLTILRRSTPSDSRRSISPWRRSHTGSGSSLARGAIRPWRSQEGPCRHSRTTRLDRFRLRRARRSHRPHVHRGSARPSDDRTIPGREDP